MDTMYFKGRQLSKKDPTRKGVERMFEVLCSLDWGKPFRNKQTREGVQMSHFFIDSPSLTATRIINTDSSRYGQFSVRYSGQIVFKVTNMSQGYDCDYEIVNRYLPEKCEEALRYLATA